MNTLSILSYILPASPLRLSSVYNTCGSCRRILRHGEMAFGVGAALLDAIVLAVVSKETEGTYGYRITQDVRRAIEISESTLFLRPGIFKVIPVIF